MNTAQMAYRCPDARVEGTSTIPDYELVFRGPDGGAVATIEPKDGCSVPVVIWSISASDEFALDIYEGFPRLYIKQDFNFELKGEMLNGMAYIMTPGRLHGAPSATYLRTISQGYEDFNLNRRPLALAAKTSAGAGRLERRCNGRK